MAAISNSHKKILLTRLILLHRNRVLWLLLVAAIKNKKSSTRLKLREATMEESCEQNLIVDYALAPLTWRCSHIFIFLVLCCVVLPHLCLLFLTCIMSESVGSGDGYLPIDRDSSFEEDWQFIIRIRNNNNDGSDKKKRRGGGSKKGKSKNKNRNRRLGHSILIKVRCCCCCFLLIVAFVLLSHSTVLFFL